MKKIAFGTIKEHIKTHESIKTYEVLRNEVLTMAMFSKTEAHKVTQAPVPMDLNAVIEKIRHVVNENHGIESENAKNMANFGGVVKTSDAEPINELDQAVTDIMAMIKGKGKGETRQCYNCGKTGHLSKDCWQGKGKGKGKGLQSYGNNKGDGKGFSAKGSYKGSYKGDGKNNFKGGGKGGPKGGCYTCGGDHYQANCPKGGKGVNGVEDDQEQAQELGGGGDYDAWAQSFDCGIIDYELPNRAKTCKIPANPNVNQVYGVNTQGEWEKVTFVGDSGAVDHVITKDSASGFKLLETPMSRKGVNFTAANGTTIENYGGKMLNGVTDEGLKFKMRANVTGVKKNLASFPKIVEQGNDIFLSLKGCYIKNEKTGFKLPMRLNKGGTPEFDLWLKKANVSGRFGALNVNGEADISDEVASPFQRLEEWI